MKIRFRLPALCAAPLLVIFLVLSSPASAATAADFIRQNSDRVFSSLSESNLSNDEYLDRFRHILLETFDIPYITRFVLGRYWRLASAQEKEEFAPLFEAFLIRLYASWFRDLSNRKLRVLRSVTVSSDNTLVLSEIEIPDKPPVKVDWRVRQDQTGFRITDVVVEGLSMGITQRDEFAAVIRRGGGKVGVLISALRKKVNPR